MPVAETVRAAIYARFSSDLQDERSIARQVADLRQEADRQGWQIVEIFTDEGISGESIARRAGVKALLAGARDGRFDVVLTEALDRVSRNAGHTHNIYDELAFHGVTIYRPSKGAASEIDIFVEGLVASQQMKGHREKVRSGQREATRRGRSAGGIAYGYDVVKDVVDGDGDPVRGLRRVNAAEASVIRRVYAAYIAGVSTGAIVEELNNEGIPSPSGGAWSVNTIIGSRARGTGLLHNRLYIGELIYNRVRMVKNPATGLRLSRTNAAAEREIAMVPDLQIIDREIWDMAQARMTAAPANAPKSAGARAAACRRPKHLLAGLARCGSCGGPLNAFSDTYLRCANYSNKRTCGNARKIRRQMLEENVRAELRELLHDPEAVAAAVKELHDERRRLQTAHATTRRSAAKELADVGGKIARLVAAIEAGAGDLGPVTARLRDLEARRQALTADMAAADAELKIVELAPDAHEIYRRKVADLETALFGEDPVTRAEAMAALRTMIASVTVYPREGDGRFFVKIEGEISAAFEMTSTERGANRRGVNVGSGGGTRTPDLWIMIPSL